jgi:Fe-S-cluster containining protein
VEIAMPEPWYQNGLQFECTRCCACCTGGPGSVLVSDDEIAALAAHEGLSDAEFRASHTRTLRGGDVSLREKRGNDCVFFERGRGCAVYDLRPRQCRTWPFWRSVVSSPESWSEETRDCPGMDRGAHHAVEEIEQLATDDGTRGLRQRREAAAPVAAESAE